MQGLATINLAYSSFTIIFSYLYRATHQAHSIDLVAICTEPLTEAHPIDIHKPLTKAYNIMHNAIYVMQMSS